MPSTMPEAVELASRLARSGLIPGDLRGKPEDILVVLLSGHELGISPLRSLQAIHVIRGRPVLSADLLAALVMRSPLCLYFSVVESTPERCTVETHRKGSPRPERLTWTLEQAKAAGLTGKDTWKAHAATMLSHRARAALARRVYPDLVMGIYCDDEADEFKAREVREAISARGVRRAPQAPPPEPPPAPEEEAELVDTEDVEEAQSNLDESAEDEREPGADEEEVPAMPSTVEGWVERVSGALSAQELDELAGAWKSAMPREAHRAIGVASKARREALAASPARGPQLDHYDPAAEITRGLDGGVA